MTWHRGFVETMDRSGESTIRLYQSGASYSTTSRPDLNVGTQVNCIIDLSCMAITSVMTDVELKAQRDLKDVDLDGAASLRSAVFQKPVG